MKTTRERILDIGLKLWPDITLRRIAERIGISHQAVSHHFPQGTLKDEVAKHAVENGESKIIVQLCAMDHIAVRDLSPEDRTRHFQSI